jgi:hypothetical protein
MILRIIHVKESVHQSLTKIIVGFEVITAIVMNFATLWDIALCNRYMSRHITYIFRVENQSSKKPGRAGGEAEWAVSRGNNYIETRGYELLSINFHMFSLHVTAYIYYIIALSVSPELLLSHLQQSTAWVHLSWLPAPYTDTRHSWHNSTRKICGTSNSVVSEAKWLGLSSEFVGKVPSLLLRNQQNSRIITFSCGVKSNVPLWLYWAGGKLKQRMTAAVGKSNNKKTV